MMPPLIFFDYADVDAALPMPLSFTPHYAIDAIYTPMPTFSLLRGDLFFRLSPFCFPHAYFRLSSFLSILPLLSATAIETPRYYACFAVDIFRSTLLMLPTSRLLTFSRLRCCRCRCCLLPFVFAVTPPPDVTPCFAPAIFHFTTRLPIFFSTPGSRFFSRFADAAPSFRPAICFQSMLAA